MGKSAKKETASDPGSDPSVLYDNYIQECKFIGIEPSQSLKAKLENEENALRGEQIVIVGEDSDALLGPGGCRALVNAMIGKTDVDGSVIQHPYTATKDLRILRSGIKDGGAVAISTLLFATARRKSMNTALERCSEVVQPEWKIEYLELADNCIAKSGANAIGRALSVGMNKTLTSLVLDFNNTLGSEGIVAMCKGLSTNSTLKKLSLKHCGIDEEGGKPLAQMLLFKRLGLISLDLTGNRLGGVGLALLCDGLIENSSVNMIRLAENSIEQSQDDLKALRVFANVLSKNKTLVAVDLLHNRIGSDGGLCLLETVKANTRLTEFKVDSNMDDELYKELFKCSAKQKDKKKKGSKKKKK